MSSNKWMLKPVLPRTVLPKPDECLIGIGMRNARLVGYPSSAWISDLLGRELPLACQEEERLPSIASCFDMEIEEVRRRSYVTVGDGAGFPGEPLRNFWGHALSESFIDRRRLWLCPSCYSEDPYLRAHWSLVLYRACHVHGTPLIWRCPAPQCGAPIDYRRRNIELCGCGQNLLHLNLAAACDAERDLAKYLYDRVYSCASPPAIGSAPRAFAIAPLGDFMTVAALLLAQVLELGIVHGFPGILAQLSRTGAAEISEALPVVLSLMEDWPHSFDRQIAAWLRDTGAGVDIENLARGRLKPLLTWELPESAQFLASNIDVAITNRRKDLFRVVLGENFREGDERAHLSIADAAARLGIKADEVHALVTTYALLGPRTGRRYWPSITVADGQAVRTISRELKRHALVSFEEACEEVVNVGEAKRVAGSFGITPRELLGALLSGSIRYLCEPGLPVNLSSVRINYRDLLGWLRGKSRRADGSIPFFTAAVVGVMDHGTLEQICRAGLVECHGQKGFPDQRKVDLASLLRFREDHRIASRTVESARVGRGQIAEQIARLGISPVAGPQVGGKAFVVRLDDMKRIIDG